MSDPTSHSKVQPVVGHGAAWGKSTPKRVIEPYTYSEGATDTMAVRVREKIDIHGVGMDVVDMQGMFVVRRDHACPLNGHGLEWGKCVVKTEFRALELYGESAVFGSVRVHLDPRHSSHGEVGAADAGSLAASCVAHCFPTIELPDLGLTLNTNGTPVALASKVVQIPPVGDVARSENSAFLTDEAGRVVGEIISSDIEVGDVIFSIPLGKTGVQTPEREKPSGQCFYTHEPGTVCMAHAQAGAGHEAPAPRDDAPTTPAPGGVHSHDAGHAHTGTAQTGSGTVQGALMRVETQLQHLIALIESALAQRQ